MRYFVITCLLAGCNRGAFADAIEQRCEPVTTVGSAILYRCDDFDRDTTCYVLVNGALSCMPKRHTL